jgi:hypothetical protein
VELNLDVISQVSSTITGCHSHLQQCRVLETPKD